MTITNIIKRLLPVTLWIIIFELISVIISLCTQSGMHSWYPGLNKSSLTPPGYVFGIVWPLLYFSLAVFGWILNNKRTKPEFKNLFKYYWIQMVLNWVWSPVFFYFYLTEFALVILMLLVIINAHIIRKLMVLGAFNISYIILPYFLWLCFALYLNTVIVLIN